MFSSRTPLHGGIPAGARETMAGILFFPWDGNTGFAMLGRKRKKEKEQELIRCSSDLACVKEQIKITYMQIPGARVDAYKVRSLRELLLTSIAETWRAAPGRQVRQYNFTAGGVIIPLISKSHVDFNGFPNNQLIN